MKYFKEYVGTRKSLTTRTFDGISDISFIASGYPGNKSSRSMNVVFHRLVNNRKIQREALTINPSSLMANQTVLENHDGALGLQSRILPSI